MTRSRHKRSPARIESQPEPMVDARVASVALRLPHYWFSDPTMRERYRIPHYAIGSLIRYRMSELYDWATHHCGNGREGSDHGMPPGSNTKVPGGHTS